MISRWVFRGGLSLFALFIFLAVAGPWVAPYRPGVQILSEQLSGPSVGHWLGQNQHGEDLLTLLVYGSRVSLFVGLATVAVSLLLGTALGLLSGYKGGKLDVLVSRAIEIILAFPGILLAVAIAAVLGPSVLNIVIALAVSSWVPFARLVRGQTLALREREFVTAARVLGAGDVRILLRHIVPNLMAPLIVQATFSMAAAILTESSLSFLGLGTPSDFPSWGRAMSDGARYLLKAPHLAIFPGIAIMLCVLSLNFLGDGLRDRLHGNA